MTKKTNDNPQAKKESQTYQNMLNEVEQLVGQISHPDLDLDDIVTKVEQGFTLIQDMRGRLETIKNKVETIREQFDKS